ncbi:MAG: carboxypeptidase-like regulatory domain-containing protein [Bacteroidetes bacterium]|nr:MAG: carboxypeptidase-like regulatory domain-containing protein [Bacteroidota bacterium]
MIHSLSAIFVYPYLRLMLSRLKKIGLVISMILSFQALYGQFTLSGTIRDERNNTIPFAKVFVKNDADQRTVANADGQYEMRLIPGEYYMVFNATGYENREVYVTIRDRDIQKDVQLFPIQIRDIGEVEASAKKSNPGREIMLKVVAIRDQINPWNYPHSVNTYIRAYETKGVDAETQAKIDQRKEKERKKEEAKKEKKKKKKNTENEESEEKDIRDVNDPFNEHRKELSKLLNNHNLVEIQLQRHYAPPRFVKEIRKAYTKKGSDRNLYYLTTVKSNFNFFSNLLRLDDLHESPVSSPISTPGILSYKYRLEAQYMENGRKIHKIKIIPRKTATTTLSGYIYVIDSLWLVQKLDLSMEKGNLLKYDWFRIEQEFEHPGDSLCVLSKQVLSYGVKYKGNFSSCKTNAVFSNYDFNPHFDKKFFSNELAVTEQEAYEKDSSFWNQNRAVVLTEEEKKFILARDSIHERLNRKEYLDSIDSVFNKVTALKILWFGVDHRIREKKIQWSINPAASVFRFLGITGPTLTPGFDFFKKWKDERYLDTYNEFSYGLVDRKLYSMHDLSYRYNPFKYGTLYASFNRSFDMIRVNDAFSQIINPNNFIGITNLGIGHYSELVNGLFLYSRIDMSERRSLEGSKFLGFFDLGDFADSSKYFVPFETYQAFIFKGSLSYTPQQKYMREPYRKVILGSKWPTIYMDYEKGIRGILGSDVDHDYIQFGVTQTFKIGTIGTSKYHIKSGFFINSKRLYDADFRYHRRSDPIWFSNPLGSFQQLAVALPSKKIFYEGHFIHHDNGSIINKVPFMKKLNIGLVFGGGALYVKEFNYFHSEVLAGLERTFKFARRRLRIGIYAVASDGNQIAPTSTYKISFAFMNDRNMKWNF